MGQPKNIARFYKSPWGATFLSQITAVFPSPWLEDHWNLRMKSRPGARRQVLQHSPSAGLVHTLHIRFPPSVPLFRFTLVNYRESCMTFCGKGSSEEGIVGMYTIRCTRICALWPHGQELAKGQIVYVLYMPTLWVRQPHLQGVELCVLEKGHPSWSFLVHLLEGWGQPAEYPGTPHHLW